MEAKRASGQRLRALGAAGVLGLAWITPSTLALTACGGGAAAEEKPAETGGVSKEDEEKAQRLLDRAREENSEERLRLLITRFSGTQAADAARADLGVLLANQAGESLKAGDLEKTEEKALEAKVYGDLATTRRAQEQLDQVDDKRSELVSKEANEIAATGKCASALKRIAGTLGKKARERYRKQVQAASRTAIVTCLAEKIEDEVKAANVDGARSLLDQSEVRIALDKQGQDAAERALAKSIVKRSLTSIQPLLEKHEWEPALAEIDKLKAAKTLDGKEYEAAISIIQDAILKFLLQRTNEALVSKSPATVFAEIDAAEKLARWKRTPDELTDLYALLAVAIECENTKCKVGKPKARYSWGKIQFKQPSDVKLDASGSTKHAQKVWVLAESKEWALVSLTDPGDAKGAELYKLAAGWATQDQLKSQDTELWLPPLDQLAGTRVWGPLREGKLYHLGIVKEVVGKENVVVRRLSDDEPVTVKLSEIRVGTLKSGLKVMAFCVDQLHPEGAKVDKVITAAGGMPKVKVLCDKGGKERVEVAGALTSEKGWLPPKKP